MLANRYFVIGPIGSDAGYWTIGPDGKPIWHPGWEAGLARELLAAAKIVGSAGDLRQTPHLAESILNGPVMQFLDKSIANLGQQATEPKGAPAGGTTVVIIAA